MGGAWPFLARGLICLVDSANERDLRAWFSGGGIPWRALGEPWSRRLPSGPRTFRGAWGRRRREGVDPMALGTPLPFHLPSLSSERSRGAQVTAMQAYNRSVMPFDVPGRTRTTLVGTKSYIQADWHGHAARVLARGGIPVPPRAWISVATLVSCPKRHCEPWWRAEGVLRVRMALIRRCPLVGLGWMGPWVLQSTFLRAVMQSASERRHVIRVRTTTRNQGTNDDTQSA